MSDKSRCILCLLLLQPRSNVHLQSVNSQFSLRLEKDGETYTVFDTLPKVDTAIQGTTTVTIRVQNSSVLDYEKVKIITFQVG